MTACRLRPDSLNEGVYPAQIDSRGNNGTGTRLLVSDMFARILTSDSHEEDAVRSRVFSLTCVSVFHHLHRHQNLHHGMNCPCISSVPTTLLCCIRPQQARQYSLSSSTWTSPNLIGLPCPWPSPSSGSGGTRLTYSFWGGYSYALIESLADGNSRNSACVLRNLLVSVWKRRKAICSRSPNKLDYKAAKIQRLG